MQELIIFASCTKGKYPHLQLDIFHFLSIRPILIYCEVDSRYVHSPKGKSALLFWSHVGLQELRLDDKQVVLTGVAVWCFCQRAR